MMEIFRILDELELLLKQSRVVPFTGGKTLVESHRFLDRVDRIRAILPEELEAARLVLIEKDKIVNEACAEAEQYMEHSKHKVARMVTDSEITKNAMGIAEEIVAKGEQVAREIRQDADEYADGVLSHMEIVLRKGLDAVMEGREQLKQTTASNDL